MKHIVQFSGGKDSTAMLLMMLEKGMPVDEIIFCDTTKEFPQMYDHIEKVHTYIHTLYGKSITTIKSEHDFDWWFRKRIRKRSKYKEDGYGWPSAMRRWCTNYLKVVPFNKYIKGQGEYKLYLGIAADEPKRVKGFEYPLVDWGITERQALEYCYSKGFDWSGLYKDFRRVSCYLCPLQRIGDWRILRKKYPELFADALELDKHSCYQFKPEYSLHDLNRRFEIEDMQQVLF